MWKSFYDQVRSSLGGLDDYDLPDDIISNWGLEEEIAVDLDGWYPNHDTVNLDSTAEKKSRQLRVYIRYLAVAVCIRVGFGYIHKAWTDGSGKYERFEGDWKVLAAEFAAKAASVKQAIKEDLGIAEATTSLRPTMIGIASPDRDPVTTPRSTS